jgi:hypothetical protein
MVNLVFMNADAKPKNIFLRSYILKRSGRIRGNVC